MSLYIQANAFSQNILPFPIGHQNWVKFEKNHENMRIASALKKGMIVHK